MKISGALKSLIKKMEKGLVLESQHPQNYHKAREIIKNRKEFRDKKSMMSDLKELSVSKLTNDSE